MIKRVLAVALTAAFATGTAQAASFANGGFETGDFSGWTQGAGCWSGSQACTGGVTYPTEALPLPAANFLPGGANYDPSALTGTTIVSTAGTDGITGQSLSHGAQYGNYAARLNDTNNNYSVSVIKQSVANYDGTSINFAWWAVLEDAHGPDNSDNFSLSVTNDTTGIVLYNTAYSSATTPGFFTTYGSWYSSGWQDITLAVTQGDNYTITLLASDCAWGGHAGYVYLDGFGTTTGGGGDGGGTVPEPASIALLGIGLVGMTAVRRRKIAPKI